MGYNENSKQSVFNAGVALAIRLDSLQQALNAIRYNPKQFNPETETFNYQVRIDSLDGLRLEGWSKFDSNEKKVLENLNKLIKLHIKTFPPVNRIMKVDGERFSWNDESLNKLMKLLDIYEIQIKDALEKHSLNSPNRDDDDEDDI